MHPSLVTTKHHALDMNLQRALSRTGATVRVFQTLPQGWHKLGTAYSYSHGPGDVSEAWPRPGPEPSTSQVMLVNLKPDRGPSEASEVELVAPLGLAAASAWANSEESHVKSDRGPLRRARQVKPGPARRS